MTRKTQWVWCFWLMAGIGLADGWLGLDGAGQIQVLDADAARAPEVMVLGVDGDGLTVSASCSGVLARTVGSEQGPFVTLSWPDAAVSGAVGEPQMPLLRRMVIIPPGATWTVSIQAGSSHQIDLQALGLPNRVWPRQAPVPKIEGARESAPFDFSPTAYAQGRVWLEDMARLTEIGIWRGHRIALLEIMPVSYDAQAGTLGLIENLHVDIGFSGARQPTTCLPALPNLGRMILNPPGDALGRVIGNYLVVVAQAYETDIAPFVAFKTGQGHTVTTHVVAPGTAAADIQSYIVGLYGVVTTRPDYVLLVGDTDTIPCWTGGGAGSPDTDLPYACMDGSGDWIPDIPIGRFSVRSTAELQAVIDKAIAFQTDFPTQGYLPNAVFMAGDDNYQITEGTHNYCIDTHMIPNEFVCDKVFEVTYGATTQDTRNSFNDGRFYGIYSGHGGEYSWADGPAFSQSDVEDLDDDQMYSFICSFACVTGSYDLTECFTETWHRVEDHGAVAIYGSSVNSYWDEDDILQRRLFDGIYDNNMSEVSPAWQAAEAELLIHYGATSTVRRYHEMYNLLGDPSTPLPESGCGFDMCVTPGGGMHAEGQQGGPFSPDQATYVINNKSAASLEYQVNADVNWITIDNGTGTIPAGSTQDVVVHLNELANGLGLGDHQATISLVNLTNHSGDTSRLISLTVGVPVLIYQETLDSDPGWNTEGDWAFGPPMGQGGSAQGGSGSPDPSAGYTGSNVYGYNLDGNYVNDMPEYHLTSTPFDCMTLTKVSLKFRRWLGVERNAYDHARVWVSTDGSQWNEIWANENSSMYAGSWETVEYDLSSLADLQPAVYLRWTMGTTDGSVIYCGWNIDDIEIWGLEMEPDLCPLDLDDDGDVDADDFMLACAAWCQPSQPVDGDGDGRVTMVDYVMMLDAFGLCPE